MKTKVISRLIIILVILIIILGGVFAYLYFSTDLLKTNEQLFFKYLVQVIDMKDGFIDSQLPAYFEKKKTSKYEDSGKLDLDIDISGMEEEALQVINDFNIEYSGQIDNTNRKNEQNITINYSDSVNFPIKYKYANETLGLQTDYISGKYIGIENSNLKEMAEKFGMDTTENFPDTINFFEDNNINEILNMTEEEREQIRNTYLPIIEDKIKEKEFGRSEENGQVNYYVEITNQELKELVIALLEALKNDTVLLPKIENVFGLYINMANTDDTEEVSLETMVQEYIDTLNTQEVAEGTSSITVSQINERLTGISVNIAENQFKIEKSNSDGTVNYNFELKVSDTESTDTLTYFASASYQGLEQLSSVNETYQFGMTGTIDGEEQNLVQTLNCTDTFKEDINITDYAEDEVQILNEYDSDQIMTLLASMIERIIEVNDMQMEEIGFSEYGNPIMYTFPLVSLNTLIYNQASEAIDESSGTISETEIAAFNSKFMQYEGEQSGTSVRAMLQTVVSNNMSATEDNQKVEVTGDVTITKDTTEVPAESINTASTYNVEMQYNGEGRITSITITQNNE